MDFEVHDGQQNDWDDSEDKEVAPVAVEADVGRVLHLVGGVVKQYCQS